MNETQQTIFLGAGMVALAVLAGSYIIAHKLSRSLDDKDFWKGSNIPDVAKDAHAITDGVNQFVDQIQKWTRA